MKDFPGQLLELEGGLPLKLQEIARYLKHKNKGERGALQMLIGKVK